VDARVRVTRMIENTTPTTVMANSTMAATTSIPGTSHKLVRSASARRCAPSPDDE
jgi:hypothetical protein